MPFQKVIYPFIQKTHIRTILNSYSEILFLNNPRVGLLLFAATIISPNTAVSGLIAVLSAYLFARFIGIHNVFLSSGFYTYNALLVGLSIGALFRLGPLTVFLLLSLGILTFIVTNVLSNIFSYYFKLPILSLPFVIVSSIAYLAVRQYAELFVISLYPHDFSSFSIPVPYWIEGYLQSMATILFMSSSLAGLLFAGLILFTSRILFFLSLLGYYVGTVIKGLMTGSMILAFANHNHFNFILIAMALGGVFLIPSMKSYVLCIIAVGISTIFLDAMQIFWANFGIPAFTLPFNIISLGLIYVLGVLNFPLISRQIKATPEETLDHYLSRQLRFQGYGYTLSLPFSGEWTVWQTFNTNWTHQGAWQYAYDFVITDDKNNTHSKEGQALEDYFAYKKPVLSPVRGTVTRVVNHLQDNAPGQTDSTNNWGNLVVIQDYRGFFVEISHFAFNSIQVKPGSWVECGSYIGLCGNSGYSPQPHIHVQVQATEEVGSTTLPFSFVNYIQDHQYHANHLPSEKARIAPLHKDMSLETKTSFILDQEYQYEVWKADKKIDHFSLIVKMALDGSFYFQSDKAKLYFGQYEGTFYLYHIDGDDPYLKLLFMAIPRMPLNFQEKLAWEDYMNVRTMFGKTATAMILLLSSFSHRLSQIHATYRFLDKITIEGLVKSTIWRKQYRTRLELDEVRGFHYICVNDIELKKINPSLAKQS
ncbi:MAG: urea transporter [SAR324 cluster bacterium]|nr:urea transporter [SAR324 cluster bacterium]